MRFKSAETVLLTFPVWLSSASLALILATSRHLMISMILLKLATIWYKSKAILALGQLSFTMLANPAFASIDAPRILVW